MQTSFGLKRGDNHEDFKSKLNIALARKQWNQRDLRDNSVVSSQTTLNINKGKPVMPATAGRIAAALGVDVTEIIEEED